MYLHTNHITLFSVTGETWYKPATCDKEMDVGWATIPAGKVTGICEYTHVTSVEGFFVNLVWDFKVRGMLPMIRCVSRSHCFYLVLLCL